MDLPPSGWYPDPYGTPSLLRWWDGSTWTHHTHPDVTPGNGMASNGGEAAVQATAVQSAVGPSGVQATAVQSAVQATAVQSAVRATTVQAAVQATAVQSAVQATAVQSAVQATAVQSAVRATTVQAAVQATAVQPSTEWLRTTKPPTGRPTAPQPALPATPYHMAMQATTVQPGYPQPAFGGMGGPAGGDGAGTQVMFTGGGEQPWQMPGMAGPGMGMPGGPGQGNYGYLQAQQRRRWLVFGGVTAGVVAAIAAIAIVMTQLSSHAPNTVADQAPATTPPPSPIASHSAAASPSASPSATATPTGSLLADGQSGLSYTQLPAPWQGASCPSSFNNGAFTWTAGEYAVAGQVLGGSESWYGEACSGPLPQQYGYTGSAQLESTAVSLEQTFQQAYYGDLNHTVTQENSQPVSVSGHVGWEVTYDIVYTDQADQGETWADEQAAVVVVDNGTQQPAVFFTSIPANLTESNVQTLVSSLALSTSAASSPTATDAATDGSGDGGQGNGN